MPKLYWIVEVRVGTLVLFPTLGEMLSIFHHWANFSFYKWAHTARPVLEGEKSSLGSAECSKVPKVSQNDFYQKLLPLKLKSKTHISL